MTHVLAVLLLAVACALWALVRHRAGESGCREATPDCGDCALSGPVDRADGVVAPLHRDRRRHRVRPPTVLH